VNVYILLCSRYNKTSEVVPPPVCHRCVLVLVASSPSSFALASTLASYLAAFPSSCLASFQSPGPLLRSVRSPDTQTPNPRSSAGPTSPTTVETHTGSRAVRYLAGQSSGPQGVEIWGEAGFPVFTLSSLLQSRLIHGYLPRLILNQGGKQAYHRSSSRVVNI